MKYYRLLNPLRRAKRSLIREISFSYQFSDGLTPLAATTIAAAYVIAYFYEVSYAAMQYDTLSVRVSMAILFLIWAARSHWPRLMSANIQYLWILFLTIVLPYCYGSILIFNAAMAPPGSPINMIFVIEYVLSAFFLVQLVFHIPLILSIWCIANLMIGIQLAAMSNVEYSNVVSVILFVVPFFLTILLVGGLINNRLFKVQREKEQAVWNVANAIAHQLRTPLASIGNLASASKTNMANLVTGYSLSVEKGLVEREINKNKLEILSGSLHSIENEVIHSNSLIDILIANSRPFERLEKPITIYNISNVVSFAVKNFPYNNPKEKDLVTIDSKDDFEFEALEHMVLHVLYNLIANAVEFSQKRRGEIKITTRTGSSWNRVEIWDSGIGIPRKHHNLVFEPFFSRNSMNGTGIGLSFCHSVMEGLGGKIELDSVENQYCKFTLFFPKVKPN